MVVLDERAQASRTQNTTVERETENDVAQGYLGKLPIIKNNIGGVKVDGSNITSEASGTAGQEATLTGQIAYLSSRFYLMGTWLLKVRRN